MRTIGLKTSQVKEYLIDMINALHYCHSVIGLIHRDIKPDNIMINHNDEAVLIDFGVSALVDETDQDMLDGKMGSYMFFAPEMFASQNQSTSKKQSNSKESMKRGEMTDIWALGITIYYLLTGQYPCEDAISPLTLRDYIINRPINFELIKQEQSRKLLQKMLEKNPDNRATL